MSGSETPTALPAVCFLTERDVDQMLEMPDVIEAVEGAFRALANGTAGNAPRQRVQAPGIVLHSMSAAAEYLGVVGWKQYTTTRHGARFHVGLYDHASGAMLALFEADRLGQMRTGAVTGVAARHLAPEEATTMGLIGTGWQAQSQLAAVAAVSSVDRFQVYGRDADRRQAFARTWSERLQRDVVPVDTAQEAARGAQLVVTATTSRTPVLQGDWLEPGTLVCAIGSNWRNKAEIDVATIRRAGAVVCDDVACCEAEAGDLVPAIESGQFRWEDAIALADVVAGRVEIQRGAAMVVFKSVGMAIEDVAVGAMLLGRARAEGRGRELPL